MNKRAVGILTKKFVMFVLIILLCSTSVFAQLNVIDPANLMQSIEQVYQYYQQIKHTIEQVQTQYEELQASIDAVQHMNWDDLNSLGDNFSGMDDNPFEVITGVYESAQDITAAVNKNMNKINRIQEALTDETIKFGGMSVSFADICGAGDPEKNIIGFTENAWEHTKKTSEKAVAGYVGNMSYAEKRKVMRRFGMSPKNYATITLCNVGLNQLVKESNIEGTNAGIKSSLEEAFSDANALNTLLRNMPEGSELAAQELIVSGLGEMIRMMGNLDKSIKRAAGLASQQIHTEKIEEAIKEEAEAQKAEAQKDATRPDNFSPVIIEEY